MNVVNKLQIETLERAAAPAVAALFRARSLWYGAPGAGRPGDPAAAFASPWAEGVTVAAAAKPWSRGGRKGAAA